MHDHFEEGDGGDADILEVMRVFLPGFSFADGFLVIGVIGIEGVAVGVD